MIWADAAFDFGEHQGEHVECGQLGGEGFGGGDADFRAGMGEEAQRTGPDDGRFRDVTDGQGVRHTQVLRVLECGQGVGGLAGLGDSDDQRPWIRHAIAIAVFTGDFDADRQLGQAFQPVTGGEAGVVAGAASQYEDAVDVLEDLFGFGTEPTDLNSLGAAQHVQRVDDGTGLLEDFFLHVVGIGAQFDGISGELGFGFFPGDRGAVLTGDAKAIRSEYSNVAVLEIHHASSHLQQGSGIRGGIVGVIS